MWLTFLLTKLVWMKRNAEAIVKTVSLYNDIHNCVSVVQGNISLDNWNSIYSSPSLFIGNWQFHVCSLPCVFVATTQTVLWMVNCICYVFSGWFVYLNNTNNYFILSKQIIGEKIENIPCDVWIRCTLLADVDCWKGY